MEKIIVGKITNSHGIKGEVKIQRTGEELFNKDIPYYIGNKLNRVSIERSRISGDIAFVKFREYDNINQILEFKSQYIYVDKSNLDELEESTYYIHDLIGMNVYDEDEIFIGKLVDVLSYSANDVYIVEGKDGNLSIPAVKEFILNVDIKNKKMKVKLIEGM
ncbi:MAG: ribosome maturation factor RimM [Tissierellia bacterium]|nr:ribosome maturation factor RimM [Tissierellia bacterium]